MGKEVKLLEKDYLIRQLKGMILILEKNLVKNNNKNHPPIENMINQKVLSNKNPIIAP